MNTITHKYTRANRDINTHKHTHTNIHTQTHMNTREYEHTEINEPQIYRHTAIYIQNELPKVRVSAGDVPTTNGESPAHAGSRWRT
jgi:hypothetical protein